MTLSHFNWTSHEWFSSASYITHVSSIEGNLLHINVIINPLCGHQQFRTEKVVIWAWQALFGKKLAKICMSMIGVGHLKWV